nr:MAG TPA: hypothetical protein [Caudoviricetes sp.]
MSVFRRHCVTLRSLSRRRLVPIRGTVLESFKKRVINFEKVTYKRASPSFIDRI